MLQQKRLPDPKHFTQFLKKYILNYQMVILYLWKFWLQISNKL